MADRADITPELCRQLLRYEPETGKLFWKIRGPEFIKDPAKRASFNTRFAGKLAFTNDLRGYRQGEILNIPFLAHRVIWAIVHGRWPDAEIDHINGIRDDNRLSNLRTVDKSANMRNTRLPSDNKSGVIGVSWDKSRGMWRATISFQGKNTALGRFANKKDAVEARSKAEKRLGYDPRHGSDDAPRYPRPASSRTGPIQVTVT